MEYKHSSESFPFASNGEREEQYYTLSNGMKFHYFDMCKAFEIYQCAEDKKWYSDKLTFNIPPYDEPRKLVDKCVYVHNSHDYLETIIDCWNDLETAEAQESFLKDFENGQNDAWSSICYSVDTYEKFLKLIS